MKMKKKETGEKKEKLKEKEKKKKGDELNLLFAFCAQCTTYTRSSSTRKPKPI